MLQNDVILSFLKYEKSDTYVLYDSDCRHAAPKHPATAPLCVKLMWTGGVCVWTQSVHQVFFRVEFRVTRKKT